jgi:hypothetical protein
MREVEGTRGGGGKHEEGAEAEAEGAAREGLHRGGEADAGAPAWRQRYFGLGCGDGEAEAEVQWQRAARSRREENGDFSRSTEGISYLPPNVGGISGSCWAGAYLQVLVVLLFFFFVIFLLSFGHH